MLKRLALLLFHSVSIASGVVLIAFPSMVLAFYFHVANHIGRYPVYGNPYVHLTDSYRTYAPIIDALFGLSLLSIPLSFLVLLIGIGTRRRGYILLHAIGLTCTLFLLVEDPKGILTWYFE